MGRHDVKSTKRTREKTERKRLAELPLAPAAGEKNAPPASTGGSVTSLRAAEGLVDHDLGIGQDAAHALGAGGQQEGAHGSRHADAQGRDRAAQVLHGVIDRHARRDRAAGAVDVEVDLLIGVLHLQKEHLRDDQVRRHIVDLPGKEDDAVLEQAGIDVIGSFAAVGLFYDDRDKAHRVSLLLRQRRGSAAAYLLFARMRALMRAMLRAGGFGALRVSLLLRLNCGRDDHVDDLLRKER